DFVGHHLQCADHHCAHSARAEGRGLSPDWRWSPASAQPADLWARRHHYSVHRHQGNRPRRYRHASRLRRVTVLKEILPTLVFVVALSLITGLVYPLVITGIAELAFPYQAQGSLIEKNGKVVGAALIGQQFASDKYFHGRPSATLGPDPSDPSKNISVPYNA